MSISIVELLATTNANPISLYPFQAIQLYFFPFKSTIH